MFKKLSFYFSLVSDISAVHFSQQGEKKSLWLKLLSVSVLVTYCMGDKGYFEISIFTISINPYLSLDRNTWAT